MKSWLNNIFWFFCVLFLSLAVEARPANIEIVQPQNNSTVSGETQIAAKLTSNSCDKNMSFKDVNDYVDSHKDDLIKLFGDSSEPILDYIKAILYQESSWTQFAEDGSVYSSLNNDREKSIDLGIAQINSFKSTLDNKWDFEKIQSDEIYNLQAFVQVLKNKYDQLHRIQNNKNPIPWQNLIKRAKLSGHSNTDILLKGYNGYKAEWDYVNSVKKNAAAKPWENQIAVQCLIDAKLISQQKIKLVENFQCSWDSMTVKDGQHKIETQIPKQSTDQADVIVKNENKEDLLAGEGIITISRTETHVKFVNEKGGMLKKSIPEIYNSKIYLSEIKIADVVVAENGKINIGNSWFGNLTGKMKIDITGIQRPFYDYEPKLIDGTFQCNVMDKFFPNTQSTTHEWGDSKVLLMFAISAAINSSYEHEQPVKVPADVILIGHQFFNVGAKYDPPTHCLILYKIENGWNYQANLSTDTPYTKAEIIGKIKLR